MKPNSLFLHEIVYTLCIHKNVQNQNRKVLKCVQTLLKNDALGKHFFSFKYYLTDNKSES